MKKRIFKCFPRQVEKWLALLLLCGYFTACADSFKTGYDYGTPQETGNGRIDNTSTSTVETQIAATEKTPDGNKVISCKVNKRGPSKNPEKWAGENLFASVLYLASPANLQKGKYYRVSLWIKSSKPTPLLLTFKDKTGFHAGTGESGTVKTEINGEWRKIAISFAANSDWSASVLFAQVWFGLLPAGETLWVGPLELETLLANQPLSLAAVANMGFKDEVAGDGKGGWSDQGPENDLREFDLSRRSFEGIEFNIVDPNRNNGKAVLTFSGPQCKTNLTNAKIACDSNIPAARYLYLLHTTCWNQLPKETVVGTAVFHLADGTAVKKEIKTGIDVADWWGATGVVNGKVAYKKMNGSNAVGLYLSKLEIAPTAAPVREVELISSGNTVWIVVGATLSNCGIDLTLPPNLVFQEGAEWKAADMSDIQVKAHSALDMASLPEPGPAGKHGRAVVSKTGGLAFTDSPEVNRRLTGFLMGYWELRPLFSSYYTMPGSTPEKDIARFAELVRLHGYDFVRLHGVLDGDLMAGAVEDGVPNPANLALLDRLVAELKRQGVYIYLDIAAYGLGYKGFPDGYGLREGVKLKARMMVGDAELRRRWMGCAKLLEHVNPHTGLALKDDPAVICVNFYNEQCTGAKIALDRFTQLDAKTRQAYEAKWSEWLASKGLKDVPIPSMYANTPAAAEFHRFFTWLSGENLAWCEKAVRDIGYKGLVTMYNSNPDLGCSSVRWEGSQIVSTNSYHDHPTTGNNDPGAKCEQTSSVENLALTWCYANGWRFQDRPLIVSELNHCFWNRYRHEGGLLYPAYSALNGFGGLVWHMGAVDLTVNGKWPRGGGVGVFRIANSPVARANAFLSLCLFKRGDVKEAPHRVELDFPAAYLRDNSRSATNSEQRRIGLMTNFSVAFPELKPVPGVGAPRPADIKLLPDVGSEVVDGLWASTSKEAKGLKFSLDAFVEEMKAKGILPAGNLSDPAKGVFQSETGELTLRVKEKLFKAVTPRTEAVSLLAGKSEPLGCLTVGGSSVDALVAGTAVDGRPLGESFRMVLLYVTEEANSGMELSADRSTLIKRGGAPALLRVGRLEATLKNANAAKMSLYALGFDGCRRERLPLAVADGVVKIALDTAALKKGPTPFFELVAE